MTTNPPYSCCVSGCSETRVFTSYVSHLLSHKLSEFSEATRKNIGGGVKGELISLCPPKISKVPNHKAYKCCFGCKKMYARPILQDEHKRECKNKDAHKEACKKLLETASTTQEAEPQATPLPVDNSENEALKKEVADLKKQLAEKPVAPASDNTYNLTQSLFKALDYIYNTREDFEGFAETLIKIKKFNGQDIYETCLDQFCADETQKNEFRKEFE